MTKAVTAQMFAAKPPRHDDKMALQPLTFQHSQDDHTRPGFAIITFEWRAIGQQHAPRVMSGLGIGFVPLEGFQHAVHARAIRRKRA